MIKRILLWALTLFLLALGAILVALAVEFGTPSAYAQDDILQQQARAAIKAHHDDEAEGLVIGFLSPGLADISGCAFKIRLDNSGDPDSTETVKFCGPEIVKVLHDCLALLGAKDNNICQRIVGDAINQGGRL